MTVDSDRKGDPASHLSGAAPNQPQRFDFWQRPGPL
jgi:hypothetical protein